MGQLVQPKQFVVKADSIRFKLWQKWCDFNGWNAFDITYRGLLGSVLLLALYSLFVLSYIYWTINSWQSSGLDQSLSVLLYFLSHLLGIPILLIYLGSYVSNRMPDIEDYLKEKRILASFKIEKRSK